MLQTSARLLRLLSLFQAKRYWSGTELAERLAVTERTLRRDVDRLRSLGYPVNSTSGTSGGYQLGAGAALPPLLLEDDEAVAVAVALRTASGGAVTGIEEASIRALTKLEQVLPSRLRRRVAALHSSIVPLGASGPRVDAQTLSVIAGACRDREGLRFQYEGHGGEKSVRIVEPHQLVHAGWRWYLAAWDTVRNDWRTFRVDRIQSAPTINHRFAPRQPPEGGFAAYVSRSVAHAPYTFQARVLMHAPAQTIAERVPPTAGAVEPVDDKTCLLHTGANSPDALCVYLTLAGVDFEVQEPPELVASLEGMMERFRRAVVLAKTRKFPS